MCAPQGERVRVEPVVERVQTQGVLRAVESPRVRVLSPLALSGQGVVFWALARGAWVRVEAASSG